MAGPVLCRHCPAGGDLRAGRVGPEFRPARQAVARGAQLPVGGPARVPHREGQRRHCGGHEGERCADLYVPLLKHDLLGDWPPAAAVQGAERQWASTTCPPRKCRVPLQMSFVGMLGAMALNVFWQLLTSCKVRSGQKT